MAIHGEHIVYKVFPSAYKWKFKWNVFIEFWFSTCLCAVSVNKCDFEVMYLLEVKSVLSEVGEYNK